MNRIKINPVFLLIGLLGITHLLFLPADPDSLVDIHTRGAWTDEGLYSAQTRNFIHFHSFGIKENTTMIRGPLFNMVQLPFFFLLGDSLLVARLISIACVVFTLFLFAKNKKNEAFAAMLAILGFTQFQMYQFSHYAMAEIMAVCLVLLSLHFLLLFDEKKSVKNLFLATLMMFFAYGLKIQFIYLVALIPAIYFFSDGAKMIKGAEMKPFPGFNFLVSIAFAVGLLLVYVAVWYIPNRSFYDFVMMEETAGRFVSWEGIISRVRFNIEFFIWKPTNFALLFVAFAGTLFWIISCVRNEKTQPGQPLMVLFAFVWLAIESHKLSMIYLPQRYLLGFYAALSLIGVTTLYGIFRKGIVFRWATVIVFVAILVYHSGFNYSAFQRRTFDIQTLNQYFSNYSLEGKVAAGVWAPSATWLSQAKVVPLWNIYLQNQDLFKMYHPSVIISESDEEESDRVFARQGIYLDSIADSSRIFPMWRYKLSIYWMPADSSFKNQKPDF